MFKALIITKQKKISKTCTKLNRQVIQQSKNDLEQLDKEKLLQKQVKPTLKSPISQQQHSSLQQKFPFPLPKIQGTFKLFHQYQLQRNQDSVNQSIIEKKKQQIIALSQFKTNILAVVDIMSQQDRQKILIQLLENVDQIQGIDMFFERLEGCIYQKDKDQNQKEKKQSNLEFKQSKQQRKSYSNRYSFVIYFKNSLMAQEFHRHFYKQFLILTVYLKEVIILQRSISQQLSYQEILTCFKYTNKSLNKISTLQKPQTDLFQRQWIELPKCPNCLLKLEFEVSGIDQKLLIIVSQNKELKKLCQTCKILQNHRIQSQNHRKLSHQQGFIKDHFKIQEHAYCDVCKQKSDIWICMVCGTIGCGRYKNADAYKHFVKSGHIITIDLQTQRVWNYLSDCFSHKLLKNIKQTNVRFPQLTSQQGQSIQQSTLQSAFWQYCSVFSQQMQRQRIFYQTVQSSQQQKYQLQLLQLQKLISELQTQSAQKVIFTKRSHKQKNKLVKKNKELEQRIVDERMVLKDYEEWLKIDQRGYLEMDEDVMRKKKELEELEKELEEVLVQLSK